jgi:peptidoglycan/xylan/chitin deacetylase (PgdA/CDA1 family)
MYHEVRDVRSGDAGADWFAVSPATFARHLDAIRDTSGVGCSIARALEAGSSRIAISFDDGVRSQYEHAFPALVEHGMTATFFVVTNWVGRPGYVTWPELREMRDAGMSIQSHTRGHPFLSELGESALREELAGSKGALDDALGQDTDQLAFPGGDPPRRRLRNLIGEAGYRVVATSRWGRNRPFASHGVQHLRRCTVAGDVPDAYFRKVLRGDRIVALRRTLRELLLGRVRAALGPSRYAAWRRRVLKATSAAAGRA